MKDTTVTAVQFTYSLFFYPALVLSASILKVVEKN